MPYRVMSPPMKRKDSGYCQPALLKAVFVPGFSYNITTIAITVTINAGPRCRCPARLAAAFNFEPAAELLPLIFLPPIIALFSDRDALVAYLFTNPRGRTPGRIAASGRAQQVEETEGKTAAAGAAKVRKRKSQALAGPRNILVIV